VTITTYAILGLALLSYGYAAIMVGTWLVLGMLRGIAYVGGIARPHREDFPMIIEAGFFWPWYWSAAVGRLLHKRD